MSTEYWRDITTDQVVVVPISDVTDTVEVDGPVVRALLDRAGFVQMTEWPDADQLAGGRPS